MELSFYSSSFFSLKRWFLVIALSLLLLKTQSQNGIIGDGFGGRSWYSPSNFGVGPSSAFSTCDVTAQLYGWGQNSNGQLANGAGGGSFPVPALGMTNVKYFSGGDIMAAIKTDGSAWVWGSITINPSGFTSVPQQVISSGVKFCDVGMDIATFVKDDGTVWSVGRNINGAFGNGTISATPVTTPVQMTGITNAVRVAVGGSNAGPQNTAVFVLLANGNIMMAGGGATSSAVQPTFKFFSAITTTTPVLVGGISNVVDIKACYDAAYALTSSGDVYSWGHDDQLGCLGQGNSIPYPYNVYTPTKINFPVGAAPIVAISACNDGWLALAIDENHQLYGWGYNQDGQLSAGPTVFNPRVFFPVNTASGVKDIMAGKDFTYILKNDNSLWAAGLGPIWMNLTSVPREVYTQIDPSGAPMNLCSPIVLSVKMISFSAQLGDNCSSVKLNWSTASEQNSKDFTVERSEDGTKWQIAGTIPARGNSNIQTAYSYTDKLPLSMAGKQNLIYRLKGQDVDGKITYSDKLNIKLNCNGNTYYIYPNPFKEILNIQTPKGSQRKLQLYNATGALMVESIIAGNTVQAINTSDWPQGVYVAVVFENGKKVYSQKIVK